MDERDKPSDFRERCEVRKKIKLSGREIIGDIRDRDLRGLVEDLMTRNEEWVLNHRESLGADRVLSQGFLDNQIKFIRSLEEKLLRLHRMERGYRECETVIGFNLYNEGWGDDEVEQFLDETLRRFFKEVK